MSTPLLASSLLLTVVICLSSSGVSANTDNTQSTGNLQEYCNLDSFRPQCMKNEVIVIQEAYYGRRQVGGRCVDSQEASDFAHDSRFFGCFADVGRILHTRCSGKKQCEVRVPDAELETTRTCLKGLQMFLEVSYTCVVVVEEDRSCVVSVSVSPQHITWTGARTPSNAGTHCGTRTQPWLLEAPAGQRINISLLDFTSSASPTSSTAVLNADTKSQGATRVWHSSSTDAEFQGNCKNQRQKHLYGHIIDKSAATSNKKNVSICGGDGGEGLQKLTNVYLSTASVVELTLTVNEPQAVNDDSANFLVRVEAVGCSNLVPPEDAWIKRQDDTIIIGCYTSRQTWQLRCHDGRWIGVVSNCTGAALLIETAAAADAAVRRSTSDFLDSYAVAAIVAIGFGCLAICLTIICCGIVCLQRFYAANGSEKLEKCWDSSRGAINNGQRFKLLSRGQNDECASQHPTFRTCDNALMTGNGMTASFVNNR